MAAYRRVYDSRHLRADCQVPGSAPEPYARQSSMGYLYFFMPKRNRWAQQNWMDRSTCRYRADWYGPKEPCIRWGHINATWWIRLMKPCAAAMRPYVRLLWPPFYTSSQHLVGLVNGRWCDVCTCCDGQHYRIYTITALNAPGRSRHVLLRIFQYNIYAAV